MSRFKQSFKERTKQKVPLALVTKESVEPGETVIGVGVLLRTPTGTIARVQSYCELSSAAVCNLMAQACSDFLLDPEPEEPRA